MLPLRTCARADASRSQPIAAGGSDDRIAGQSRNAGRFRFSRARAGAPAANHRHDRLSRRSPGRRAAARHVGSGAWKVASDICSVYPVGHDRPNCEVFVYPEDPTSRRDRTPRSPITNQLEDNVGHVDRVAAGDNQVPAWKRAIDVMGAMVGLDAFAAAAAQRLALRSSLPRAARSSTRNCAKAWAGAAFESTSCEPCSQGADENQSALRELSVQDGPAFKMENDPRTTWIGRWLRTTSLDELPQFWNVLRGDMSLVGPRPLPVHESVQCAPWQRQRLSVVPGMTCIWQVTGRSRVSFDEWMRMDLQYVRRRSCCAI